MPSSQFQRDLDSLGGARRLMVICGGPAGDWAQALKGQPVELSRHILAASPAGEMISRLLAEQGPLPVAQVRAAQQRLLSFTG